MPSFSLDFLLHRKYAPRGQATVLTDRNIRSLQTLIDDGLDGKQLYELLNEVVAEARQSGETESRRRLQQVVVDLIALNASHIDSLRLDQRLKRYADEVGISGVKVGPGGVSWRSKPAETTKKDEDR